MLAMQTMKNDRFFFWSKNDFSFITFSISNIYSVYCSSYCSVYCQLLQCFVSDKRKQQDHAEKTFFAFLLEEGW